ncbi:hypothetical protein BN2537_16795 [Streptomyces venezuelae]|nr:hypothetical protein BN2537_16795 [Streptomyces venezuelae]
MLTSGPGDSFRVRPDGPGSLPAPAISARDPRFALVGAGVFVLPPAGGTGRSGRPHTLRPGRDGKAVGVSLALEGGEPGEVPRRTHPRRRIGRAALQQFRHHSPLVRVDAPEPAALRTPTGRG